MPRLSPQCMNDVKTYTDLRYSHLGDDYVEDRTRKVIKALKRESIDVHKEYSAKVQIFLETNKDVIATAKEAHAKQSPEGIQKMLDMEKQKVIDLVVKHGGNVNAALAELDGDNDKQH